MVRFSSHFGSLVKKNKTVQRTTAKIPKISNN